MKQIQLTIAIILGSLVGTFANAQCGLIQINRSANTGPYNYGGQGSFIHWACSGDTVTTGGGGGGVLYLDRGSYAHIHEGGNHTVWARNGSTIVLTGEGAETYIYHEPGATVIMNMNNFTNMRIRCATINFDPGSHPSPPCPVAASTSTNSTIDQCYFNSSEQLVLKVSQLNKPYDIHDMQGRLVARGTCSSYYNNIDLPTLDRGVYYVTVGQSTTKVYKR